MHNLKIEWSKVWKKRPTCNKPKYAVNKISNSKEVKEKYQQTLNQNLTSNISGEPTLQEKWNAVTKSIKDAAEATAGLQEKIKHQNRTPDAEISALSTKQKHLRIQIENCTDEKKITELRKTRNRILHQISSKVQDLRNKELDEKVSIINNTNDAARMFKATKMLHRKPIENTKVHTSEGKFVTEPNDVLTITTDFFENKFVDEDAIEIETFEGEARPLNKPIQIDEVKKSLNRLNNNRAVGPDGIPGELYKYGSHLLSETITECFNNIFETHENIDINFGDMITPPKPGKPKAL